MDKLKRQIVLLIFIAISAVMPTSLYSSRKYCDAAIVGILQGNPKEVVITELRPEEARDYYAFNDDGSISLCIGFKPCDIVRDDMGRLISFKLPNGNTVIQSKIEWDDTNAFEVKKVEYVMTDSETPGVGIKQIEKFEYGVRPGGKDERKDRYANRISTRYEELDENGNHKDSSLDFYYEDGEFFDVKFDEKGNMRSATVSLYEYASVYEEHKRDISYYPDECDVELKITHDNYKKALDEIDSFVKSPFGLRMDLSKTNGSNKKSISIIEKYLKSNGWSYNPPSKYLPSSPWVIDVLTPLSFLGNKCKVKYQCHPLDKDQTKYFDAGYIIEIKLQGSLYELMQFANNLEALFTDYGLRKSKSPSYGIDPKDYYFIYGHTNVNEDTLYYDSNKRMLIGWISMYIPKGSNPIDNSTLTVTISYDIRK